MGISGTSGPIPPIKPPAAPEGPLEVTPKGGQEIREFQGPTERGVGAERTDKPSPMSVAEQLGHGQGKPQTLEEIQGNMSKLQDLFVQDRDQLRGLDLARVPGQHQLELQGHLNRLEGGAREHINPLNRELGKIADVSGIPEYAAKIREPGQSILSFITEWIDGGQRTLADALTNVAAPGQNPDPARMLQMQYSVQRATQRAEQFTSIISAAVQGIRTIMTTQIG